MHNIMVGNIILKAKYKDNFLALIYLCVKFSNYRNKITSIKPHLNFKLKSIKTSYLFADLKKKKHKIHLL